MGHDGVILFLRELAAAIHSLHLEVENEILQSPLWLFLHNFQSFFLRIRDTHKHLCDQVLYEFSSVVLLISFVFNDSLLHKLDEPALTPFNFQTFDICLLVCCQSLRQVDIIFDHKFEVLTHPFKLLVLFGIDGIAEKVLKHLVRG